MNIKAYTIMVVEDDKTTLTLIEEVLRDHGFVNIVCFHKPVEALNAYQENTPDLVLLDIHMPEMNGFAWLDAVKEVRANAKPPIMVLTAEDTEETAVIALQRGAKDFVHKPFHIEVFVSRVINLLNIHAEHLALISKSD